MLGQCGNQLDLKVYVQSQLFTFQDQGEGVAPVYRIFARHTCSSNHVPWKDPASSIEVFWFCYN